MARTTGSPRRILPEGLLFLLLAAVWAGLRILPALDPVFPEDGGVVLLGNDPWFHLHQTEGAIEHFPHLIRWDVGSNFPLGNRVAAAGLFHLGAAAVSLGPGGGAETAKALAPLVLAWSPVLLGALSLAFLYLLAREIGGRNAAVVTILLRILFPGEELERTLLGFGDYHAAEILLATAGLWTLTRCFNRLAPAPSPAVLWKTSVLAAVPLALFQFVWFGSPLHVAVTLAAFWAAAAAGHVRSDLDPRQIRAALPVFVSLSGLTGLTGWLLPEWIMAPSGHRQALLALFLQAFLILAAGSLLPPLARRIGRRGSLLLSVLLAAVLVLAASRLLDQDRLSYQIHHFLAGRNPFISEHLRVDFSLLGHLYGFLPPFAAGGLFIALARHTSFGTRFALLSLAAWTALWIRTSDFGYLTGALLPLPAALALIATPRLLATLFRKPAPFLRPVPWIAVAASLLLLPSGRLKLPFLSRDEVRDMVLATPAWREAMSWVRGNTPVPPVSPTHLAAPWPLREGFAYPEGSYGILAHWSLGNLVPALGKRLAVLARSHSPFYIDWFLQNTEDGALRQLATRGDVRYLVLDATSVCDSYLAEALQAGLSVESLQVEEGRTEIDGRSVPLLSYGEWFRSAFGAKLYLGDGAGMRHHRLVYESREVSFVRYRLLPDPGAVILKSTPVDSPGKREEFLPLTQEGASWTEEDGTYFCYSGQLVPTVKIYERVAGAILEGKATPRETATLELDLRNTLTGRTFTYRATRAAADDGTVRFTLPYPTTRETGATVRATGPCRLLAGGVRSEIEVDEAAVRAGTTIRFGKHQ
jgi:asparagine N-glycosylation enzyme membrane subunit Stt3